MTADQLPPQATINWARGKWSSIQGEYSREHRWLLDGGVKLLASDAKSSLSEDYRNGVHLDPEKTFVATIASAHMLSWLHVAFSYGIEVESYRDTAVGVLSELSPQVYWISEVILHPRITYNKRSRATVVAEVKLHERAHEQCFIAQSIKTKVTIHAGLGRRVIHSPGIDCARCRQRI
jgi:organic hydroperoxide reductase OsmC/OhrA